MMKFQSGYADGEDAVKSTASTYLDPQTKTTYSWDSKEHQWKPQKMQYNYPDNYQYTDPRTSHTYIWKANEQRWHTVDSQTNETINDNKTEAQEPEKTTSQTSDENLCSEQGIDFQMF